MGRCELLDQVGKQRGKWKEAAGGVLQILERYHLESNRIDEKAERSGEFTC